MKRHDMTLMNWSGLPYLQFAFSFDAFVVLLAFLSSVFWIKYRRDFLYNLFR